MLGEGGLASAGVAGQDDASEVGGIDALHRHRRVVPHDCAAAGTIGDGASRSGLAAEGAGRGPAILVGYTPARDVRSFQVVHDQAPEGRQRRQARRALHQGRPRDQRRRARRAAVTRTPTTGSGSRSRRRARSNMPADNIKRAIEKATGGGDAEQFEEIVYEGYGPGGVAILVEAATDNRNRTAAEVRSIFTKTGGQLAGLRRGRLAVRAARPDRGRAQRQRPRRGRAGGDRRGRRGRRHRDATRSRSTRRRATSRRCARRSRAPASRSTRPRAR